MVNKFGKRTYEGKGAKPSRREMFMMSVAGAPAEITIRKGKRLTRAEAAAPTIIAKPSNRLARPRVVNSTGKVITKVRTPSWQRKYQKVASASLRIRSASKKRQNLRKKEKRVAKRELQHRMDSAPSVGDVINVTCRAVLPSKRYAFVEYESFNMILPFAEVPTALTQHNTFDLIGKTFPVYVLEMKRDEEDPSADMAFFVSGVETTVRDQRHQLLTAVPGSTTLAYVSSITGNTLVAVVHQVQPNLIVRVPMTENDVRPVLGAAVRIRLTENIKKGKLINIVEPGMQSAPAAKKQQYLIV